MWWRRLATNFVSANKACSPMCCQYPRTYLYPRISSLCSHSQVLPAATLTPSGLSPSSQIIHSMKVSASCNSVTHSSSYNSNATDERSSLTQAPSSGVQVVLARAGDLENGQGQIWGCCSSNAVLGAPTPTLNIPENVTTIDVGGHNIVDEMSSSETFWWGLSGHPWELVASDVAQASGELNSSQGSSFPTEPPQLPVPNAPQPSVTAAGGVGASDCLWGLQDGSPCKISISGSHNDIVDHIRRFHGGLPSTRSTEPFHCRWGSCQKKIKPRNLPRHITGHAGIRWRCSGCEIVLSRKDYAQKHIKRKGACRNEVAVLHRGC
ncbi:hypothetical protein BDN67DRAFT_773601 [Paxillus ammoniavirescens]|nr:hypothetical protein BDN67DRAFT_773601 [Paxillus ammoniavirescens]